jgi:hypothetical protein
MRKGRGRAGKSPSNDCILDVTLLGKDTAVDLFVYAPPVRGVAAVIP